MVGYPWEAHGAEQNLVALGELLETGGGHHRPGPGVVLATPVKLLPFEGEAEALSGEVEQPLRWRHHFGADAVAGDHGNAMGGNGHGRYLRVRWEVRED